MHHIRSRLCELETTNVIDGKRISLFTDFIRVLDEEPIFRTIISILLFIGWEGNVR